jgi:L-lactate dehydrogenase complex protein LldG
LNPRDTILAAVRANLPSGRHDRPDLPAFPIAEPDGRLAAFARNLKQMGGQILDHGSDIDPLAALRDRLSSAAIVCSATPEITGNRPLAAVAHPKVLADVDVAVVRAAFAVAETGSVLFTEAELQENALVYLAQHLVVLVDPADVVASIQDAYRRRDLHEAGYAVFHTGPSATADIEGVLIHGAQGVRSLSVLFVPRNYHPGQQRRDAAHL